MCIRDSLLLDDGDVTGAVGGRWKVLDERTWRTGQADPDAGWAQRARGMGSVTAWRSFGDKAEARWLWCQVVPLASADDVIAAADGLADTAIPNRRAKVELVAARDVEVAARAHASVLFAREQETAGSKGAGFSYVIGLGVGPVLAVVSFSGTTTLDDAMAIADALGRRIHDRTAAAGD